MVMLTERANPLREEETRLRAFDGTGLDQAYDSWATDEWPACRMTLPHGWRREQLRLTFACRRGDAFPDRPGYPDPDSNWTIAQRASDLIEGLASRWALACLLDGYHQLLSIHRDRAARQSSFRPVGDVKQLRGLVRAELLDIMTASMEVSALAQNKRAFRHDVLEMKYCREVGGKDIELLDELRARQRARAKQVEHEAELLMSTLQVSADMTQTVSNIRVQRLALLLSVVSIVIAVAAIVVAVNSGGSP